MANPFDIANFNLMNWAESQGDLWDSTPKDVVIAQKDANGIIHEKTVANRGKFQKQVWDDVGGALGQFNKTFYVNYTDGDDNNNGTSSSPFKTIEKAVNSCPIGGKVYIILSNEEHLVNYRISAINKYITIAGTRDGTIIRYATSENNRYNTTYGWNIENSTLLYQYIQIIGDSKPNPDKGDEHGYWGAMHTGHNSKVHIHNYGQNAYGILIPNDGMPFIRSGTRDNKGDVSLFQSYNRIKSGRVLIDIQHSAGVTSYTEFGTYERKDYDGNDVSPIDLLSGVVKDSNGVPRNILSNYVL